VPVTEASAPRPPLDASDQLSSAGVLVEVVPESPSTNAVVAERARAGAVEGLVVVAEHQTAGRGRLDRSWDTPPRAALTFSVLVRPTKEPEAWPWLPLLAGVVVAGAVRELGVSAELKWPNDVLVAGRKVAGILVERVDTPQGPAAVVGVGVNVTTRADELPVSTAGSLSLAGATVDRSDLLRAVLGRLRQEYDAWQGPGGSASLRASYLPLCATARGQAVRVELPTGPPVVGTGVGVAESGGLEVDTGSGTVTLSAGDVVHVRPGDQ
jgi:BirA family biotin operon repressor/biotin-[acetyl-CoA-carboxylase] ligase